VDPTRTLPPHLIEAAKGYVEGSITPAEPRNAATVVLLRSGRSVGLGELEVYLLRRHVGMSFAAGMSVFPGGGVDPRDAELPASLWAGPSPAEWGERMGCTEAEARSLVIAAVRETFEESSVLLAGTPSSVVADTTDLEAERAALESRELSFSELLAARGWVLRSDLLAVLGGWLTPIFEPKRYRTWFFVAAMPTGQVTRDVSSESDAVAWMSLRSAISAVDACEMLMLPPTYATCCEFFFCTTPADAIAHAASLPHEMIEPAIGPDGGRLVIPDRLVELGVRVGELMHP